jgi:Protein of unknown function (DUF3489)
VAARARRQDRPLIASVILSRIALLFKGIRVIHIMTAEAREPRRTIMTTFTINAENTITAFPTPDLAESAVGTGEQSFNSEGQLAELAAAWPAERLVQIWNSFAGVAGFGAELKPIKKFTDRKTAIKRIWTAIQKLDGTAKATPETAEVHTTANGRAQAAQGAPKKGKATKTATSVKNAPKGKKGAKAKESVRRREGTKTAQVVALLQRKNGATLSEIMEKMGWQKHTVRGFMAGAMKKAGYRVESFKPEGGERTYRINAK